jgi:hypothetical protein
MTPRYTHAMTREAEATALRDEWARLHADGAALSKTTQRLEHSDDVLALRMHQMRLQEHHSKLHALVRAMEQFHHRYGAIGGLSSD